MAEGDMTRAFAVFVAAVRAGSAGIEERPGDRSFLESTLVGAITRHLTGRAMTDQGRRRFALEGFDPAPYGVDIDWQSDDHRVGIETKVSDVRDSLFDVIKLTTAVARGEFTEGFCAVAANAREWDAGGAFSAMTRGPVGEWRGWSVEELLAAPASRKAVLVSTGPRPHTVPARIETMAVEPIAMPNASTHTLRVLAVRPAAGTGWLQLPRRPG